MALGVTLDELGGWPSVLSPLLARQDLTAIQTAAALAEVLRGTATDAQIAAFIVALRMKGETTDEIGGLLAAMLDAAEPVTVPPSLAGRLVDTCGTGGDRSSTINVSTTAALVVAGAGVPVCKHGNRAVSSTSGSADVLEALGVAVDLGPEGVATCITEAGIGFCFAPRFHPALRHAGRPRRELGIPTVLNFLGPIANPARVRRQVVGVSDPTMAERILAVLAAGGSEQALVVYGHDGLDELTTTTTSTVLELRDGSMRTYEVDPARLGLAPAKPNDLQGGNPAVNAAAARRVLDGIAGPHRDVVVLNAAAGLVVAGVAANLAESLEMAAASIDEGRAAAALDRLVTVSQASARP